MSLCKETRPEHCGDWLSPDEVVRMAVHALAVARVQARPPPGERFKEPGDVMGWSCREDFANNVSTVFELQVKALAYRLGIGGDHFEAEGVRLTKWDHDSTEVGDRPALGVPA